MQGINDWQYICIGCGEVLMAGVGFAGNCPKCRGTRWLCHWLKITTKPSESQETGDRPLVRVLGQNDNLSQSVSTDQNGNGRKKPGPKALPVDDLVKTLACQGLSSRGIAAKLAERGIDVSYKTIQRRLHAGLL